MVKKKQKINFYMINGLIADTQVIVGDNTNTNANNSSKMCKVVCSSPIPEDDLPIIPMASSSTSRSLFETSITHKITLGETINYIY